MYVAPHKATLDKYNLIQAFIQGTFYHSTIRIDIAKYAELGLFFALNVTFFINNRRIGPFGQALPKSRAQFWPPKPNELDKAAVSVFSRAVPAV